jgi:hypothetical protein
MKIRNKQGHSQLSTYEQGDNNLLKTMAAGVCILPFLICPWVAHGGLYGWGRNTHGEPAHETFIVSHMGLVLGFVAVAGNCYFEG